MLSFKKQLAPAELCTPLSCIILAVDKIIHHRWRRIEVLAGKPVPVIFSQLQIPHGIDWKRTLASVVRDGRISACAMARSMYQVAAYSCTNSERLTAWTLT